RAILDLQSVHIPDVLAVVDDEFPLSAPMARRDGIRTALASPLVREGVALGAIFIRRDELRPFTERQIALLETFADQAVIAIEHARLFSELEQRNAELHESNHHVSEALEQQTATAEILRAIASSPTDPITLLDTVATTARRLVDCDSVRISELQGGVLVQ